MPLIWLKYICFQNYQKQADLEPTLYHKALEKKHEVLCATCNMSDRDVSDIRTRVEGEGSIPDTTRTRMLQMSGETVRFYRSIGEVILRMHLVQGKKIKAKVSENQQNSVSHIHTPARS